MKKQMAKIGRKLSTADMKKMLGGGPGMGGSGTGSARCGAPPPRCISSPFDYTFGGADCCRCCDNSPCLFARNQDPACWLV